MKEIIVDLKNNIVVSIETKQIFTGPAHDYLIECGEDGSTVITKVNQTYVLRGRLLPRDGHTSKLSERVLTEEEVIKIIRENELNE